MQSCGDLNAERVRMPESQGQRSSRAPGREGTEERRQVSAWQGGQGQRSQAVGRAQLSVVAPGNGVWQPTCNPAPRSRGKAKKQGHVLVQPSLIPTLCHATKTRVTVTQSLTPGSPQWVV